MAVGVGSFNDPMDIPGMAHFVEHALFLGNQKYPEPNGFETFIAQHGGVRTAYSHAESTNYDFAVSPNSLNETLERFVTFCIKCVNNLNNERLTRYVLSYIVRLCTVLCCI